MPELRTERKWLRQQLADQSDVIFELQQRLSDLTDKDTPAPADPRPDDASDPVSSQIEIRTLKSECRALRARVEHWESQEEQFLQAVEELNMVRATCQRLHTEVRDSFCYISWCRHCEN